MLIYEYKVNGNQQQYAAIDEAIRVTQFIRNKCVRRWMDVRGTSKNDLQCYCAVLAQEYPFAERLNSQARQASAERLKIANLVKNRRLAKSISDAAWGRFLWWLTYDGTIHGIPVVAVEPAFTSQDCSGCGTRVKKSLSVRTHICTGCGLVLDRDHNAALNILAQAYRLFEKADRTGRQSGTGRERSRRNASGQTASTRRSARATGKRAG